MLASLWKNLKHCKSKMFRSDALTMSESLQPFFFSFLFCLKVIGRSLWPLQIAISLEINLTSDSLVLIGSSTTTELQRGQETHWKTWIEVNLYIRGLGLPLSKIISSSFQRTMANCYICTKQLKALLLKSEKENSAYQGDSTGNIQICSSLKQMLKIEMSNVQLDI